MGARLNFISALAAYQQGEMELGDQKLTLAMAFQKTGSLRLFHIALADTLYTDGTYSPRVAMDLYGEVLRDPTAADWASDPLEALSVMMTPHEQEYGHWFEVAVDRKDHERVLEISDLARRHRFLNTLEFGGRMHNLRWLLEGPEDNLDQAARLERQDLLSRYPDYEKLHRAAEKLHAELKQAPLVAEEPSAAHAQASKLAALTETSIGQEVLLRQMAVRREPCELVFPPFRATKDIKAALPEGHAILSFFSTPRQAYAILMTRDKYGYWKVPRGDQLTRPVMKLLQTFGSVDANRQMTLKDLTTLNWKDTAKQIFDAITKDSHRPEELQGVGDRAGRSPLVLAVRSAAGHRRRRTSAAGHESADSLCTFGVARRRRPPTAPRRRQHRRRRWQADSEWGRHAIHGGIRRNRQGAAGGRRFAPAATEGLACLCHAVRRADRVERGADLGRRAL